MGELFTTRREMMAVPLFAAAFAMFRAESVKAAGVDPTMTMITPPDQIPWQELYNFPKGAAETAPMVGKVSEPGQYFVLIRWHPGFMSAPHHYTSDRLCVVVSGTWWCNSGADFDPAACVPAPAGSFVHRVAGTPHYDGVIRSHREPAIIAICGLGPVNFALVDSSQPRVRRV